MNLPPLPPLIFLSQSQRCLLLDWGNRCAEAAVAAAIPPGWQVVPVEPTYEMIDASESVHQYRAETEWRRWVAMLAAAPKPGDEK